MRLFPETETTFLYPGPAGDLEVLASPLVGASHHPAVAIICHPHPLYSGTMHNKVVTTLARTFKDVGLHTVRFNFRGVGKSAGTFDSGEGELQDLFAILEWVKTTHPGTAIWLAGFSFGAYIAAKAATQKSVAQLVCVAPPVINFAMQTLPPVMCPWIVVQGDQDEIVSSDAVFEWAAAADPKPHVIRMEGSGHFFHGKLLELRRKLDEALGLGP
jgi:alpha/beta superfamily hydrolase